MLLRRLFASLKLDISTPGGAIGCVCDLLLVIFMLIVVARVLGLW